MENKEQLLKITNKDGDIQIQIKNVEDVEAGLLIGTMIGYLKDELGMNDMAFEEFMSIIKDQANMKAQDRYTFYELYSKKMKYLLRGEDNEKTA